MLDHSVRKSTRCPYNAWTRQNGFVKIKGSEYQAEQKRLIKVNEQ